MKILLSETKTAIAISNLLSRKYGNLPVYRSHKWKQSRYWFGDGTILFIYDVENHNVYVNKDHWLGRLGRLNALQTHELKAIFRTFLANSYGLEVNDVWENDFSSRQDQYDVTSPEFYCDDDKPILEQTQKKQYRVISQWLRREYGNIPMYENFDRPDGIYWFRDGNIVFVYDKADQYLYINHDSLLARLAYLSGLKHEDMVQIFREFILRHYDIKIRGVRTGDFPKIQREYDTNPDNFHAIAEDDKKPIQEHISKDVVMQWFLKYYGDLNQREFINDNGDETLVYYNSEGKKIMEYVESSDEFYIRYNLIGLQLIAMFGLDEDDAKDKIMEFFRYKYNLPVFSAQWI